MSMVTLVIVTHNSQAVLASCLKAVATQTRPPEQVVIVDSGSADSAYLQPLRDDHRYQLYCAGNIGFAAANNRGVALADPTTRYLLFLNPDAFLAPTAIETAVDVMERRGDVALLGCRLMGFDADGGSPTGRLDSTGIFRTWYGRWYDRGQGEPDDARYRSAQAVPALCGAFLFYRLAALEHELPTVFDESFFLYKEDIDLSLRLRRNGWNCLYEPQIEVYHCRGWFPERRQVGRPSRMLAARSELRLTIKHRSPYLVWALVKYLLVRFGDV